MSRPDFREVTERPGEPASALQIARLHDRYRFAASQAAGRRLLEVACGNGIGLPLLAQHAASVVAGDIEAAHVQAASRYGGPVVQLDATRLPFRDGTFDAVHIAEALYYLPDAEAFVREASRVLDTGGRMVITTVNPRWPGWLGSAHATRYYDAIELSSLLQSYGFRVTAYGAFADGPRSRLVAHARRFALMLRLVPSSLGGRRLLRRVVYGRLRPFPGAIDGGAVMPSLWTRLSSQETGAGFAILHVVGESGEGG